MNSRRQHARRFQSRENGSSSFESVERDRVEQKDLVLSVHKALLVHCVARVPNLVRLSARPTGYNRPEFLHARDAVLPHR